MRYLSVIVAVLAMTMAACGGSGSQSPSLHTGSINLPELQPLVEPAGFPAALPADALQPWEEEGRGSSGINAETESLAGRDYFQNSGAGAAENDEALRLDASVAGSAWAIYRIPSAGGTPGVFSADVNLLSAGSAYYLGIANFGEGRWQWQGPFTDSHVRISLPGNGMLSSVNNLFATVLVSGGSSVDVVNLGLQSRSPSDLQAPPVPEGLVGVAVADGAELQWLPVEADDLAGYAIYWADHSFINPTSAGVRKLNYLEGSTRHVLQGIPANSFIAVSAVDFSGNESGISSLVNVRALAGDAPQLSVVSDRVSSGPGGLVNIIASGADTYDIDLDGDGEFEVTGESSGAFLADTSRLGIIRPLVRGISAGGEAVALGSVSLLITGNSRPLASAIASPQSGQAPLEVTFTGTAEDNEDAPEELSFAWDFDGDGIYEADTDTLTPDPQVFSTAGIYNVKLRVTDSDGASDVDTVAVQATVPGNQFPTADVDASPASGDVPLNVAFSAALSADPDGEISEYAWDWNGDGLFDQFGAGDTVQHVFTEPGIFDVQLRVMDDDGAFSVDTIEITVTDPGNVVPVASFTVDGNSGNTPLPVQFDASASNDPDGSIASYEWDFDGDGTYDFYSTGHLAGHVYTGGGVFNATLRVTDDDGGQGTLVEVITVNASPTAQLSLQPGSVNVGDDFLMDATLSSDPDGSITLYEWDSDGDGSFESSGPLNYLADQTAAFGGFFSLAVRVTDDDGATAVAQASLQVNGWSEPKLVDANAERGEGSCLVIVNGHPAISYIDDTNDDLYYVRANDPVGSSWGTPVMLDNGFVTETSMIIVDGFPAIAYRQPDLGYVRALDADGTSWGTPIVVDSIGAVGLNPEMGIVDGKPFIVYNNISNNCLCYAYALDAQGTSWDSNNFIRNSAQMADLEIINGNPAVAYFLFNTSDLGYTRAGNAEGTSWSNHKVLDTSGSTGWHPNLEVVEGNPAISYGGFSDDTRYIRASDVNGDTWGSPVTLDPLAGTGQYSTLLIYNGLPVVSYYDKTNTSLNIIYAQDATGTTWDDHSIVDNSGAVGEWAYMEMVNGSLAISYFDATNLALSYVRLMP